MGIKDWNFLNKIAYKQCTAVGSANCIVVKYEDLVTEPKKTIKKVKNVKLTMIAIILPIDNYFIPPFIANISSTKI